MKLFFGVLLLAGLTAAAPTSNDDTVVIDEDFYPNELAIYTSNNDIVKIVVPLNSLNFNDDVDDDDTNDNDNIILFFVEAKVNPNGKNVDKGLYILKNHKATKLLDHGRDVAVAGDNTKNAYFGAQDGIYSYNEKENKAEKYGSVTDSIIGIEKENGTDVLYILTEDHILYKVTDEGNKKERIDDVKDAQEIVLDYSNNLYYYDSHKQPYVVNADGVKKVEGLPEHPTYVKLIKPAFILSDSVPFITDDKAYVIYANGTTELTDFEIKVKPTAYAMEGTLIQYFAHDKKIYEYNLMALLINELLTDLKEFFDDKKDEIQTLATRSRNELGVNY